MKKKNNLTKLATTVLAFCMCMGGAILSTIPANAQGIEELDSNIVSFDDYLLDITLDAEFVEQELGISRTAVTAQDQYEPNDLPQLATSGRQNRATYASIDNANDWDWYEMYIETTSKPISILLSHIPFGRDYNVYLAKYNAAEDVYNLWGNVQTGDEDEAIIGYPPSTGSFYVLVMANPEANIENNFSDSNYKLYFGDYEATGSYGYVSTNLSIDFGYVKTGNTTPVYSGWYTYDLTNNSQIPDGAIVTEICLTADGNGNSWTGFYKMMRANTQGITLPEKSGGITVFYSGTNQYYVKQQWLIGGHVLSSTYFTWNPRISFDYIFAATLDNMDYIN